MEVSEIIESVDIVDYISQFCELEQRNDGDLWTLSPLKDENTPSFSVSPDKQIFYDFSTGKGGNIIEFIKLYKHCDFREALQILKEYANIKDDGTQTCSTRLAATSIAKKFRCRQKVKKESKSVVLPVDYMERYERNEDKLSVWRDEGITQQSMERFSVRYDPFSDRIVYPIRDMRGNIINVCGRTLDPNYKEHKQRKYTYFKPLGVLDTIYGFSDNREEILAKKEIILFEGAKSVMIADGWGIKNTGALLTSHLNNYQFNHLIRMGVRVVFALDAEIDIRTDVNIKRLLPYVNVEWVVNRRNLLDEKDSPVDRGREIFETLYKERMRLR